MSLKTSLFATTTAILMLSACGGSSSSQSIPVIEEPSGFAFDATAMISNITNDIIVEGYNDLNTKAEIFHLATLSLLNSPSQETLLATQQAWQTVRQPWEQGEAHIFGPVDALSIDPHLDTWPLNTSDLQSLLATQSGFNAEVIKLFNDDVQGFHTMEFLLFGDGLTDNAKAIDEMTALEREYLAATAEVFREYTQSLFDAWTVRHDANDTNSLPYQEFLLIPGNDIYASELGVVEELINGMIGIVDEVANGKIAEPFGSDINSTDTSLVESQYSWNSLADFTNNIQGVKNVYLGTTNSQAVTDVGIINFVQAADSALAIRIDTEITTAITAIKAISGENDMPFRQAINDVEARVRIQAAIDALSILQTSLESDVLILLNNWNN
ncbi:MULTISPECIES: imelysin family protein [unclassified Colwellia]|uniref:imelysin family protein n=1 Tax=unclassified Colwellia TaxID=196834 RepID=UPI0015F38646|nr:MULTISPECIES: imelysin family protein [unclassified Colwellia]MBA6354146.1 iron-regulated protein A precursor [Colwellia sp. BRX9-1]MBA6357950.1 iron-regulated protein A precursor [Colwellia sp. BRX8-3]MBA6361803.1 iron-regulated protein A precursor [Colwellia sp. BRX8-6]MBA6369704.1 iron-regulated protein A precursor [Colwellia sp. BRX8-5]MBA6376824.1 iron-regulated protein A precursor [Colwellia sp. BRX8-2]